MADPKCFISYSWENEPHKVWVRRLAERLQRGGVFVLLDQWDMRPGMDLPKYMEDSIRAADFVVLVCTPTFSRKANGSLGGVGYEKNIVTGEIFNRIGGDTKFIPILRIGTVDQSLPSYLMSKLFLDFREELQFEAALETLLRHLHDSPAAVRPPLGPKPAFASSDAGSASSGTPAPNASRESATFNLDRFKQLRDFALGADGLNLSDAEAAAWADERTRDQEPYDLARFKQLREFAFRADGLNLSMEDAARWADKQLRDGTPFDLDRFKRLRDFALRQDGLHLSSAEAQAWAESKMIDKDS